MSAMTVSKKFCSQTTLILPLESTAICVLPIPPPPVLLEIFLGVEKVEPPSVERVKKVSIFPLESPPRQTTSMLPLESTAICGISPQPVQALCAWERFLGVEKVTPPSVERLKKMSKMLPLGSSLPSQTKLMLPLESRAICSTAEKSKVFERFLGVEKVAPPSVERLKKIAGLPKKGTSFQTTLMLPLESTATSGTDADAPAVLFERFLGIEKVAPPSAERLKKMSPEKLTTTLAIQTTLMFPLESTAMRGKDEARVLLEMFFGVENVCAWATSAEAVRVSRTARAARLMNLSKKVFTRIMAHL